MSQTQERLAHNKVSLFCKLFFIVLKNKKEPKIKKVKMNNKSNETLVK
jgi:hypothetical protein